MKTLLLTGSAIRKILRMEDVMGRVREAFRNDIKMKMPPKEYLVVKRGDFRAMPVYAGRYAGIKWVNVHPENTTRKLPSVMGIFILNDADTGFPLAVMDATLITDYRTGAAAGVATDVLSRSDSKLLGLVGCGRQAWTQFLAIKLVRKIEKVVLYDKIPERAHRLKEKIASEGNVEVEVLNDLSGMRECDIISTSTPSTVPVLSFKHIKRGVHINAMGADAPGKEELDPLILKRSRIIVDHPEQAIHSGEVNVPIRKGILSEKDIQGTLGEVLRGRKPGRRNYDEITVFDSTGLAIQDIAVASYIYEKARDRGMGEELNLISF